MAVSEACSFAIAASVVARSPWSSIAAARHASRRDASTPSAMSASRKATAWCSAIGLPNWTRSFAYAAAYSVAARARPVAAAARFAREPAVVRDEAVVQEELGVGDRALAHLGDRRAEGEAFVVAVEQEGGHAAVAGAGRDGGEDDVGLRDAAVGDPRLLAVEDVPAVDLAGARAHRGSVGAGVRLGRRERGQRGALAGQRPQPAFLLRLGAG